MSASDPARRPMRRTIRGGRPYFFSDPAIDKILAMVVVLGSEVWTLRERLAALEAIQVRQGSLASGELDAHDFSPEDETRLAGERKEFIDSLFRVLQVQVEEPRTQPVKAKAKPKAKPKVKTARRSTSAAKGRKTRR
jgi:hypothetical protein